MPNFPASDPDHLKWVRDRYSQQSKRIAEALYEASGAMDRDEQDKYINSLFNNALDDYELATYHIRLCLVSRDGFKTALPSSQNDRLASEKAIVLAASHPTAIIRTDTGAPAGLTTDTALYIQDCNIEQHMSYKTTAVGGSEEHVANLLQMNMQIHEPHGLAFDRMFREAAIALGYLEEINPAKMIWRVDIWFSGYNGAEYVQHIPMRNPLTRGANAEYLKMHSFYLHIIEMPVEVTMAGSVYTPSFVPVAQSFYTSQDLASDVVNYDTKEGEGELTLEQLVKWYSNYLTRRRIPEYESAYRVPNDGLIRTFDSFRRSDANGSPPPSMAIDFGPQQEQIIIYHIHLPEDLKNEKVPGTTGVDTGKLAYTTKDDVIATLDSWLRLIPKVQDGLRKQYPRKVYDISCHVDCTNSKPAPRINDYTNDEIHIYVTTMFEHRFAPLNTDEMVEVTNTHRQMVVRDRSLRRVYSYLYTRDNTEVEQMEINLNVYYYAALQTDIDYSVYASRLRDPNVNRSAVGVQQIELPKDPRLNGNELTEEAAAQILGMLGLVDSNYMTPQLAGVRAMYVPTKAVTVMTGAVPTADTASVNQTQLQADAYGAEWNRMVNFDMVALENFTVRGDPNWLFSYSNSYEPFEITGEIGHTLSFTTPTIYIRVYRPSQTEYMADHSNQSMTLDGDLSGFYQIVTCTHSFSGGKFTNKLQGYRLAIA